tara:strand:- start:10559 stop:13969 length:3411 start_codon:yes stop_codon:yes gene_type:complete
MPRNVNGTYTLVSGNPVVTGTVIDSNWANTTMPDFGSEITDSLSRSGKGGMLAPLRGVNGSAAVPSHSFTGFVQSGMYMAAAGDLQLSVTGVQKLRLSAGDTRPQYWSVSGGAWLNVADSVDVTTLQDNIDAEAVTRASQTATLQDNIDAEAVTRASQTATLQDNIDAEAVTRASQTGANAAAIVVNADGIAANAAAIVVNADGIAANAGNIATNTSDITTNDADIAANALAITLVGDIASIPARNTVLNQDPVSQGTSTRSGMSSTIYTGNGSTQSVATGVDMATGDFGGFVWIKSRGGAASHILVDSVRTPSQELFSNSTGAESSSTNRVDSLDSTGFSLGTSSGVSSLNSNAATYVAWSWQTTEKTTGTTNRNKAYTCHYNADLGFSITGFIGDGVDGHEISHFLGKEPELVIFKNRNTVSAWRVVSPIFGDAESYLSLNETAALASDASFNTIYSAATVALGNNASYNGSTNDIIAYNFTSIPNVCKIGTYIGTGAAGNYVDCGFKPAWILFKNLTTASAWELVDSSRLPNTLRPNTSGAEIGSVGVQFVDGGFLLAGTTAGTNGLNDQLIFMAYAEGTAFDSTKTLTNYPYATTDEVLTINSGTLMSFAEGFNAIGQANTQELVGAGVTLSFGAGYENQTRYVYKDKGTTFDSTEYRNLEGISRAQADKFGVVSPLDTATRTTDKHFSYESATGVALASGERSDEFAWEAFNKDADSWWGVASTTNSSLQYKFNEPRVLKSWRFKQLNGNGWAPKRFTIEGSNDGYTWTAIDSTYTASDYTGNGLRLWGDIQDTSANTTAYIYTRINITANNGNGSNTGISELEFNTITPSDYYNVVDGLVRNYLGDESVTNGTFDTNTTGWSPLLGATLSVDAARLKILNTAAAWSGAEQAFSLTAGTYTASCDYDHNGSNTYSVLRVGTASDGQDLLNLGTGVLANTATGSLSGTFTLAATTTIYVHVNIRNIDAINGLFDNISVKQLDAPIDRVYLAKIMTGASGELLNYENLPVAKIKGVDAEYQGNVVVHGEIKNRGICTAWVNFDGTTNPPTIRDSENVADVVDEGTGRYRIVFEDAMDIDYYSVVASHNEVASGTNATSIFEITKNDTTIVLYRASAVIDAALVSVNVFGGKSI